MKWEQVFHQEIEQANQARQRKLEAKARVCARRAANAIAQEYLQRLGYQPFRNAMQNFRWLQNHLPPDHPAQEVLAHLVQKVNEDFTFPEHIDLINEAYQLCEILLEKFYPLTGTSSTNEFPTGDDHHHSPDSQNRDHE